ncbi:hypothetical protein [Paramicrobacterium chengjingii]|uniref:Uncharacterized protein n=1 Tax=Paramicrobacterium chengjingii TaxID=2769067 RepID=A0ABX6YJ16_9MICO|nr:hypothetical protein [Microbacterium chengjingii]QPZ38804.1 hypothetical protein HCR76_01460 [Microbacterium chengjingii]
MVTILFTGDGLTGCGRFDERAFARAVQRVDVRMSVNGTDAAALGAATLVLQDTLSPRSLASITLA